MQWQVYAGNIPHVFIIVTFIAEHASTILVAVPIRRITHSCIALIILFRAVHILASVVAKCFGSIILFGQLTLFKGTKWGDKQCEFWCSELRYRNNNMRLSEELKGVLEALDFVTSGILYGWMYVNKKHQGLHFQKCATIWPCIPYLLAILRGCRDTGQNVSWYWPGMTHISKKRLE